MDLQGPSQMSRTGRTEEHESILTRVCANPGVEAAEGSSPMPSFPLLHIILLTSAQAWPNKARKSKIKMLHHWCLPSCQRC